MDPAIRHALNLKPFGIRPKLIDFRADSFEFCDEDYAVPDLLAFFRLAHAIATPGGSRVMPRWMIVDLALMPAGMILAISSQEHLHSVARRLERAEEPNTRPYRRERAAALRDLLSIASERGYDGPLPVAGYAAIPTSMPGCWLGGSLWWSLVPGEKLGYSVRRIALECYRADCEMGVTQFDNVSALRAQNGFGKLRVRHTSLAIHPRAGTFVYEVDVAGLPRDGSRAPDAEPPDGARQLDPRYRDAFATTLAAIQDEINEGAIYYVTVPKQENDRDALPVIYAAGHQARGTAGMPGVAAQSNTRPPPPGASASGRASDSWFTSGIGDGDPYKAYVMSTTGMFDALELAPFGITLTPIDICAREFPAGGHSYLVAQLVVLLSKAIALSYAESGLGTPKWAMVELAFMPSAVLVVMASQEHLREVAAELEREPVIGLRGTRLIPLAEDDRDRLRNAHSLLDLLDAAKELGYDGPLPIAGYAAAPTPRAGRWVGWSLWSLVPGQKLGYTVMRLALECYGVTRQTGVMQFRMARGVDIVTNFGMPRLVTVDMRAHPAPNAFIYEMDVSKLPRDGSAVKPREARKPSRRLDPGSADLAEDLAKMQRRIELATEYWLISRSVGKTQSPLIPIWRRIRVLRVPGAYRRLAIKRFTAWRRRRRRARAALTHPASRRTSGGL